MANYRICRINLTAYPPVFDRMYADDPDLCTQPSEVQAQRFFDNCLIYSDSFSRGMGASGNEAWEILCNAEPIQKKWAEENGVTYSEDDWIREIVWAQLDNFRPDVLYIQGICADTRNWMSDSTFRDRFPFIRLVVAYSGFPEDDLDLFDCVDVIICGAPQLVDHYAKHGWESHLVYHGFDDAVPVRLSSKTQSNGNGHAFTFSGYSGVGFWDGLGYCGRHRARYWDLMRLVLETGMEAWVYDRVERIKNPLSEDVAKQLAGTMDNLLESMPPGDIVDLVRQFHNEEFGDDSPVVPLTTLFPSRCHEPLFGLEMFDLLHKSRLTFNRHTNATEDQAFGNIRVFEATGVGTCLITDFTDEGRQLFEPDTEVVTYSCMDECVEKVKYLLDHEDERAAIAKAGQQRTLDNHTMRHRCEQIHQVISGAL